MKEFTLFGFISNLKINYSKSEAMNISIPTKSLDNIKPNCPFKWETSALTYLGIWLTPRLTHTYEHNLLPLLKTISIDLKTWNAQHFSWFGRIAICKMNILPKVLYLFRNIPLKIPQSFFKTLQSIQSKFIWAHKKPRVKFTLLTQANETGGMGIPDFRNYYYASHVTRIIDWHCHRRLKDWVELEDMLSHNSIQFSPWIPWTSQPEIIKSHPLIGTTLAIFHKLTKIPSLSTHLSPLTPLRNNPDFIPGMEITTYAPLIQINPSWPCAASRIRNLKILQLSRQITTTQTYHYGHIFNVAATSTRHPKKQASADH